MRSGFTRWDIETYIPLILGAVVQASSELDMLDKSPRNLSSMGGRCLSVLRTFPGLEERLQNAFQTCSSETIHPSSTRTSFNINSSASISERFTLEEAT